MLLLGRLRGSLATLWMPCERCFALAMAREPKPQIYAVKTIVVPEPPNVVFTAVPHTKHFTPKDVRKEIV